MSDTSQGPGWWQASDGRWYPPTARPGTPTPPVAPPSPTTGPAAYGPPGYGPPAYAPPAGYGYGYALAPPGSHLPSVNGYAIASLVLGLISLGVCCYPLMFCSLVGLPLGIYALTRITKGAARPDGKGLAIAGIVLSSIALVLMIAFGVLLLADSSV